MQETLKKVCKGGGQKSKMDGRNKLNQKLVRFFTTYRTYLEDEDLVRAKELSTDEWRQILDEALQRRSPL